MRDIEFVAEVLRDAGAVAAEKYRDRSKLQIERKAHINDLVTEADVAVQKRVVERIHAEFPGDAIYAEEAGYNEPPRQHDGRCWILDPIDGTQNFVRNLFPAWGVSLGLVQGHEAVAGGVYFPMADDLFLAERGGGTQRNGRGVTGSDVSTVELCRIDLDVSSVAHRMSTIERAPDLYRNVGQIRVHGSAVAALCSVASGDLDAYLHLALNPWDYAAGLIIVAEAGGLVTRCDGGPITFFDGRSSLLATNGHLHDTLLALVKPAV